MPEPPESRRSLASFLRPASEAGDASVRPLRPEATAPQPERTGAPLTPPAAVPMTAPITAAPPLTAPMADAGDTGAEPMPGFLRPRRRTPGWHWLLILLLVGALALQVVLADRARLAADATTRPAISALCTVLRCQVPAWHEPEAYTMTARDVRPLPGQPGNLQVRASIRNDARWEQPWPAVRLSLSDADGRVVGSRVFTASQYLDDPAIAATPLLPGQSAQLAFIVNDPSPGTVAFSFQFQ